MDIEMLPEDKNTIWVHEDEGGDTVIFAFDTFQMDHQEMFMKWVDFMNAIGYTLDKVEMERMWNGE
jgi:hypothetical protein